MTLQQFWQLSCYFSVWQFNILYRSSSAIFKQRQKQTIKFQLFILCGCISIWNMRQSPISRKIKEKQGFTSDNHSFYNSVFSRVNFLNKLKRFSLALILVATTAIKHLWFLARSQNNFNSTMLKHSLAKLNKECHQIAIEPKSFTVFEGALLGIFPAVLCYYLQLF